MKKILLLMLLLSSISYSQQYVNPDGDVISLTVMQNYQFSNYKINEYDAPAIVSWDFLIKYPSSKQTTIMVYYNHSNSQIFSLDKDKYRLYNTNKVGIGFTIYFK